MNNENQYIVRKKSVLSGNIKEEIHGTVKSAFEGEIPYSVWNFTKSQKLMDLVGDNKEGRKTDDGEALSELNPDTVKRALRIWSEKGDIVLDPFLNRGTTPIISAYLGRIGLGNDIVPLYVDEVLQQKQKLINQGYDWANNIHISNGDARNIINVLKDFFGYESVDYIISSPPFWDVEKYKSVDGQMSDISDYDLFLKEYEKIISDLNKILKIEKFVTYIVNDFRRDGKFVWFSGDTIKAFTKNGFEIHDIVINVVRSHRVSGIGNVVFKQKRTMKYHEYVITFKKVY